MTSSHVVDVTAADFEQLLTQSRQVPVLLDFWADWCGPCKTLTPILEKLAAEYGGAFVLGKVNTETEQELAQAFRVQSIPFVVLISEGKPVDAFAGAVPESEVRAVLARAGIEPGEGEAEDDADSQGAALKAAKRAVTQGDAAAAREALKEIEDDNLTGERDRLADGLALLEAELDPAESPAAEPLRRARDNLVASRTEAAMADILESIEVDKDYADALGRRAMLLCFSLLGEDHEACVDFRRRMATLLY